MIGLGTRWRFGSPPPPRLPAAASAAVAEAEDELRRADPAASSASWTLTWLEGRPIAELDHETERGFPTVTIDPVSGTGRLSYEA